MKKMQFIYDHPEALPFSFNLQDFSVAYFSKLKAEGFKIVKTTSDANKTVIAGYKNGERVIIVDKPENFAGTLNQLFQEGIDSGEIVEY